ncbi:GNAT family N-acetyltransferase [Moritella sp. 5]|uniref:GNAT family N-acetyltransferase n=1 Tax=Moritella sp. 5 TaxID=2746231 RepID=UPI001BAD4435|nr:GNAT family N-acetyltransferase [Moritella sp. 5]QUM80731.1 GNAT family N-acetyltransferase [Moritella sp. 5]
MEITDNPKEEDIRIISSNVRHYNLEFMPNDFSELAVFERDIQGVLIAGLTAKTYWERLDIDYLWVSSEHRGKGIARELLLKAEEEAIHRGCKYAQLDTFDFQAKEFYEKLGYEIFGKLDGYKNGHKRFYLKKCLKLT